MVRLVSTKLIGSNSPIMKKIIIFILLIFPLICIAEVRYKIVDLTANANFPIRQSLSNGINNKGDVVGCITTDSQPIQNVAYKYSDNEGMVI